MQLLSWVNTILGNIKLLGWINTVLGRVKK